MVHFNYRIINFIDARWIKRNRADRGIRNQGTKDEWRRLGRLGGHFICFGYDWPDLPVGFNRILCYVSAKRG